MKGNVRDRALLDCAYEFPCQYQLPGCEGTTGEPSHSNRQLHGKGMSIKAHDCFHVPGCRTCHRAMDQGSWLTREEREQAFDLAFARYLPELFKRGLLKVDASLLLYRRTA